MANEIVGIGYISREGVLYECKPWEHIGFANELCEKLGFAENCQGLQGENILMKQRGWILAKARSFSINIGYTISKAQKYWLLDFLDNFHPLTPDEKIDDAKKLVAGYRPEE